jgi:hypothetical protein
LNQKAYQIMKTKIIGVIAIAIAISLSAFTSPNKNVKFGTGPYWFLIDNGIAKGAHAVPAADASFVQQSTTAPNESLACPGTNNQCLSGFDSSQVDTMTDELKDDNEISLHQQAFQH